MAQQLLDGSGVHVRGVEIRGIGVSQVVQPPLGEPGGLQHALELEQDFVSSERSATGVREDQVELAPLRSAQLELTRARTLRLKGRNGRRAERDRAAAAFG